MEIMSFASCLVTFANCLLLLAPLLHAQHVSRCAAELSLYSEGELSGMTELSLSGMSQTQCRRLSNMRVFTGHMLDIFGMTQAGHLIQHDQQSEGNQRARASIEIAKCIDCFPEDESSATWRGSAVFYIRTAATGGTIIPREQLSNEMQHVGVADIQAILGSNIDYQFTPYEEAAPTTAPPPPPKSSLAAGSQGCTRTPDDEEGDEETGSGCGEPERTDRKRDTVLENGAAKDDLAPEMAPVCQETRMAAFIRGIRCIVHRRDIDCGEPKFDERCKTGATSGPRRTRRKSQQDDSVSLFSEDTAAQSRSQKQGSVTLKTIVLIGCGASLLAAVTLMAAVLVVRRREDIPQESDVLLV